MALKVGPLLITPHGLLLPVAVLFFAVLACSDLSSGAARDRRGVLFILAASALAGAIGSCLHGASAYLLQAGPSSPGLPIRASLEYGSFGAYWGVLIGGVLAALVRKESALRCADALVVGILAGGAVDRLGGVLLSEASEVSVDWLDRAGLNWSSIDLAALLTTLVVIVALSRRARPDALPGTRLVTFLLVYGMLRFLAEFARDATPLWSFLTLGQALSLFQLGAGIVILRYTPPTPGSSGNAWC